MVVGFCFVLMFSFVPETFWDRTPRPHSKTKRAGLGNLSRILSNTHKEEKNVFSKGGDASSDMRKLAIGNSAARSGHATIAERRQQRQAQHVGFADEARTQNETADEVLSCSRSGSPVSSDEMRMNLVVGLIVFRPHERL